jgi:hypothetical protein
MNLKTEKPKKEYPALEKRRRNSEKRAVWLRNYQRARARALTKLAQQYPDQYKDLLEKERLTDEANGRAWLDISGATAIDVGFYLPPHRQDSSYRSGQADTDEQDEGNVGGEE